MLARTRLATVTARIVVFLPFAVERQRGSLCSGELLHTEGGNEGEAIVHGLQLIDDGSSMHSCSASRAPTHPQNGTRNSEAIGESDTAVSSSFRGMNAGCPPAAVV